MEEFKGLLAEIDLFHDIAPDDLISMLSCLGAVVMEYARGEYVLMAGDKVSHVGIVLKGSLHIVKEDVDGGRRIVAPLLPGDFFAEALCCAGVEQSPVSVLADSASKAMLLSFERILHTCPNSCVFHTRLIENMLRVIAAKNLFLQGRMDILGKKSIRARLLAYLRSVEKQPGKEFTVPFNREELADFLCVDRSALSREMGRLERDGTIAYKKDSFRLLQPM